jgi:hypothetical protein
MGRPARVAAAIWSGKPRLGTASSRSAKPPTATRELVVTACPSRAKDLESKAAVEAAPVPGRPLWPRSPASITVSCFGSPGTASFAGRCRVPGALEGPARDRPPTMEGALGDPHVHSVATVPSSVSQVAFVLL